MDRVTRIGVSLEPELLEEFDALIRREGYTNRSEAIRDLVRRGLVQSTWEEGEGDVVGTVTLLYDHHTTGLVEKLLEAQHREPIRIFSTMHVHVDHHDCMEIIAVAGKTPKVRAFADGMKAIRGVKRCELTVVSTGK
jgi:CopG family nickel-responsive transcriptional regulator